MRKIGLMVLAAAGIADAETIPIWLDGSELPVRGRLVEGTTMVPLREFAEAMEMTAGEGESTGEVTISRDGRRIMFLGDRMVALCGDHEL